MASTLLRPRRDEEDPTFSDYYSSGMGPLLFTCFALILLGSILSIIVLCLRRRRLAKQSRSLPQYNVHSHRRSASVINLPQVGRNESVFVYDDKMNLISNTNSIPPSAVPQIRVTFPDEEEGGNNRSGRVVVVHVTDTGSVGMSPLHEEPAPPYQRADAERFQSLDLDRLGGLREKEPLQQRYS
jgi:hypothetical protein